MKNFKENVYLLWLAFCKLVLIAFIGITFLLGLLVIWCWIGNSIDWTMLPRIGGREMQVRISRECMSCLF